MAHDLVRMTSVSKSFGPVPALREVDFCCEAGSIHAILGENGAGKSTLMKLLCGVIRPDTGSIRIDGREVEFASPAHAARHGVVCMFQELSLAPDLNVGDNIVLAGAETRWGMVAAHNYQRARAALDRVGGEHIALSSPCRSLSLAERQQVEIAKALYRKPRLLILDEATSALTQDLVERVFDILRELRTQGASILFISHRFHEVDAIADTLSVFRGGRHVATFPAGTRSSDEIVALMIGQSLRELYPPRRGAKPSGPDDPAPALEVRRLVWLGELDGIDMDIRAGEIVGVGGLDGQGQAPFMQALFGVLRQVEGQVLRDGRPVQITSPHHAKSAHLGLGLIPEDRKTEGLLLDMSIADNLVLAALGRGPWWGRRDAVLATSGLADLTKRMGLVYGDLNDPVSSLSGGNQQKVVLAKWLALSPRCLLLMDPTRGIDVKAKAQIYRLLRELADEGMAILLQSTDHEELVCLCDRVHIFYRGRVNHVLDGDRLSSENVIAASMNLLNTQGAAP